MVVSKPAGRRIENFVVVFIALCLLSRLAYSFNDVFVGRLARQHGRMEVAAWRGVSLGVTMAPLLFFVQPGAWARLADHWIEMLAVIVLTAVLNLCQLHAARMLPFGLRAAFIISGVAAGSVILGWTFLGEQLSWIQIILAALVVGSAAAAALGTHAGHEITPDVRRGAFYSFTAAILMAIVGLLTARLARATDPLLVAWAWEFGAGAILILPLAWSEGLSFRPEVRRRIMRIAVASLPTVIGSGASIYALTLGAIGLWGAVAGTQVLFTALLGVWLHQETMGLRRWISFAVAAAAIAGLTFSR